MSLLNNARDKLASDFDGNIPGYEAINDTEIEDAYCLSAAMRLLGPGNA